MNEHFVTDERAGLDLAHLRNGYRFFAPEPGFSSSRLLCELEFADGPARSEVYPDRDVHWPRLRYHRHFMLAEQIRPADGWAESYCRHVQQKTGAALVRLVRVRRRVPFMTEVREGVTPGQKIVVAGQGSLKEGDKIRVIEG